MVRSDSSSDLASLFNVLHLYYFSNALITRRSLIKREFFQDQIVSFSMAINYQKDFINLEHFKKKSCVMYDSNAHSVTATGLSEQLR